MLFVRIKGKKKSAVSFVTHFADTIECVLCIGRSGSLLFFPFSPLALFLLSDQCVWEEEEEAKCLLVMPKDYTIYMGQSLLL